MDNKSNEHFGREHAEIDLWERRQRYLKRQYNMAFEVIEKQGKMDREKLDQLKEILRDLRELRQIQRGLSEDC